MGEKSFKVQSRVIDTKTGEIRFVGHKIVTMFCCNDGENYLTALVESFKRGLRSNDNLCLEVQFDRVEVEQVPFPNLY